jgi:hypothetical protein
VGLHRSQDSFWWDVGLDKNVDVGGSYVRSEQRPFSERAGFLYSGQYCGPLFLAQVIGRLFHLVAFVLHAPRVRFQDAMAGDVVEAIY